MKFIFQRKNNITTFIFIIKNNKYCFNKIFENLVFLIKVIIIKIFIIIIIFRFFVLLKLFFRNRLFEFDILIDKNNFFLNNLIDCILTRTLLIIIKKFVDII